MYIVQVSSYIPENVVDNAHFSQINGISEEWIVERTGIEQRRKVTAGENTNTMAIEAIKAALPTLPFDYKDIQLIVGATYTPYDTIHTIAHAVQHFLDISDIPVVSVSSACSSFANAMEIVQGYFAMNKAEKALVVVSDHNTAYSRDDDTVGGHLWGDGASAVFVSKTPITSRDMKVVDIITGGAGNVGKADIGVVLKPWDGGFVMNNGRDVFLNACNYMSKVTRDILEKNNYTLADLSYFIPHQANLRITRNVAQNLGLDDSKALSNIQYLGNTGCAGCSIALFENQYKFQKGDIIVITVFGGGYSYGAILLEQQ
ncbi:MAG: ketoacyl-ACP synthase III [Cytophagales bacterium]|nr:MAG: ketoacyl-ACP synthase III [Cytophagales bacterium]